jgi:hypothetical protein
MQPPKRYPWRHFTLSACNRLQELGNGVLSWFFGTHRGSSDAGSRLVDVPTARPANALKARAQLMTGVFEVVFQRRNRACQFSTFRSSLISDFNNRVRNGRRLDRGEPAGEVGPVLQRLELRLATGCRWRRAAANATG